MNQVKYIIYADRFGEKNFIFFNYTDVHDDWGRRLEASGFKIVSAGIAHIDAPTVFSGSTTLNIQQTPQRSIDDFKVISAKTSF